jgi:lipopolysaccharide export LptBFGC system permease protein LptF
MIAYLIPEVLVFTFPFGTMMACLMSVGRFSSDNEIQAVRATGLRYIHLFIPFLTLSVVIAGISFFTNDVFMPLGKIRFSEEITKVAFSSPKVVIEPNSIKRQQDNNATIISGEIDEEGIHNIFIIDNDSSSARRIISTPLGEIKPHESLDKVISLHLNDIEMHSVPLNKKKEFEYASADSMDYNIVMNDFNIGSGTFAGPGSKPVRDLLEVIKAKKADKKTKQEARKRKKEYKNYNARQSYRMTVEANTYNYNYSSTNITNTLNDFRSYNDVNLNVTFTSLKTNLMEFHKRLALPFSCIVFIFFSFPVGMFSKRDGRVVGMLIGVVVSFCYWIMFFGGQVMAYKSDIPVFISMWYPNAFFLIVGLIIYGLRLKK